ncbi:hypothetical protein DOTSEDRAFT_72624 [Dothistroma septosporum NZE10]|uniref:Uncharacterized protein n=1 Tax=Dothistroma septosporum (strain NZE10 / CBS 128990) TaxID=675120 RepID=M2Y4R1_DOTSN|nr:hypothetical protein DOTSEDRAFT_72624 [Dothistroma septosporum NZE10]
MSRCDARDILFLPASSREVFVEPILAWNAFGEACAARASAGPIFPKIGMLKRFLATIWFALDRPKVSSPQSSATALPPSIDTRRERMLDLNSCGERSACDSVQPVAAPSRLQTDGA